MRNRTRPCKGEGVKTSRLMKFQTNIDSIKEIIFRTELAKTELFVELYIAHFLVLLNNYRLQLEDI